MAFSIGLAVVSGRSMEPTLYDGYGLLLRFSASALPGRMAFFRIRYRPVAVKRLVSRLDDGWWVERDNPAMGVDSGQVGTIPDEDVLAGVVLRVWPLVRRGRRSGRPGAWPSRGR